METMLIALGIVVAVVVIATIINGIEDYHTDNGVAIPFKESMDLLNVPVVTFTNGENKLHFLLDTGGDYSYIDKGVLEHLSVKSKSEGSLDVRTGNGTFTTDGKITMDIAYNGHPFEEEFVVADLAEAFEASFGGQGVTVHGVLGSKFFRKYEYELNYADLAAYSKK